MRFPLSSLLGILLVFLTLVSGCDSGGTNGENAEPGPVSVTSISVGADGVATVSWTEFEGSDFGSYLVYRSAPGTPDFQKVETLLSREETRARDRALGFVGGTLRYRVDVRIDSTTTYEGDVVEQQTYVPDAVVGVSTDSTVSVSWLRCPYPDAFIGYVIQRKPSSTLDGFRNVAVAEAISDTTATVEAAFGRVDDYRVTAYSRIAGRHVSGNVTPRIGIGASFPPHARAQYAPSRDEVYVTNEDAPYVLRLDAESLSRKDSVALSLSLSKRAGYAFRVEQGASSIEQIDPTSFAVTKSLSVSALPQFDPDNTPEDGVQVLETGRLLYTAYTEGTPEEVTVYDFRNETRVGQTEEGVPATALSASYSGNYAVVETDEPVIYDVGGDDVRRVGAVPEYSSSHFHWIEAPTGEDQFATYDDGTITIRRARDLSRVRQFDVDVSLTHLGYDAGRNLLWGTDEVENRLYVFSVESGSVIFSLPIAEQSAQHHDMVRKRVFYEKGRVLRLSFSSPIF